MHPDSGVGLGWETGRGFFPKVERRYQRLAKRGRRKGLRSNPMSRKQERSDQQTCGECPEAQGTRRDKTQEIAQIGILYVLYSMHHVASPAAAASRYEKSGTPPVSYESGSSSLPPKRRRPQSREITNLRQSSRPLIRVILAARRNKGL